MIVAWYYHFTFLFYLSFKYCLEENAGSIKSTFYTVTVFVITRLKCIYLLIVLLRKCDYIVFQTVLMCFILLIQPFYMLMLKSTDGR